MKGPFIRGSHRGITRIAPGPWEEHILIRGHRYRVVKEFKDEDGDLHPIGEDWVFVGSLFSPHDELMLVVVRTRPVFEWEFELEWRSSERDNVVEHFGDYVELVSRDSRRIR
ncbi:MAG TPA: hypothetical protein VFV87_22705 [Pirellulaceae bacterium]|nr:hypothetical protein [Pirellulaceae bacterium]